MEKSSLVFQSVLVKETDSFSALCLDVDVASQGSTAEEAKNNLREAVELYVETAIESNLPIIRPVPPTENPLFDKASHIVEEFLLNVEVRVTTHV